MTIETEKDFVALQKIGKIVAQTLKQMIHQTEPGMSTCELDLIGRTLLENYGANSAPELTYGFPGYTCISINEEAAHGIPSARIIQPGDVVDIDVSAEKGGYYVAQDKRMLHEGMVIAVEPFLSTRSQEVTETEDGWTLSGETGNFSAQFEHTMVITKGKPILLTLA